MTDPSFPSAAPAEPPIPRGLVLLLGALTAFGPMSIDMYLPSLPAIVRGFGSDPGAGQLTVAAFLLGLSAGQLIYGPLSDRIGRRGPLIFGIGLFVLASIGCALAPNMPALIAARFVQALGGCAGIVLARTVVRDRFDARRSVHIYSMLMLVMGVAPVLAPIGGGWMVVALGWRSIFWLLAGFGLLSLGAVLLWLKESRPEATAIQARAESVAGSYLAVIGDRRVMAFVLTGCLAGASLFAYIAASPAVLIEEYGVPPQSFGWVFGVNAIGVIGAAQLNRRLSRRFSHLQTLRTANLISAGLAVVMTVCAAVGFLGAWGLLVPLFCVLAAYGVCPPNALAGAMEAGGTRAGSTSAVYGAVGYAVGAGCAALAGLMHDRPGLSMSLVMTGALIGAGLVLRLMLPPGKR